MSMASDISTISSSLNAIKNAIIDKGVTPTGNITTYADAIRQIQGDESGDIPLNLQPYIVINGVASKPSGALLGDEFSGITSIDSYGMYYMFNRCSGLTGTLDFSDLTSIGTYGMYSCFQNCSGLTDIDFSALISVGFNGLGYAFYNCSGLTSIEFQALTSLEGSAFYYGFTSSSELTTIRFPALTTLKYGAFSGAFCSCAKLTNIYFNALTTSSFVNASDQFNNMFNSSTASTSGTCTLHFPSNLESKIQTLTGYPLFGGTSGKIILEFDLNPTS